MRISDLSPDVCSSDLNNEVLGTYLIKYKVSDVVGNITEKTRTVKVIGPDEIMFLLNGQVVDGGMAVLDSWNIVVNAIGNEGSFVIKWGQGKRTQAYFK